MTLGTAAFVHRVGDAVLELGLEGGGAFGGDVLVGDGLVDAAGGIGHERVDDLLHVDALGLGHLGDGLSAAQLVAELGLADPERLGDDRALSRREKPGPL